MAIRQWVSFAVPPELEKYYDGDSVSCIANLANMTAEEKAKILQLKEGFIEDLSKAQSRKIKGRMYSLVEHARRHKLCEKNPMDTVRQGSKRMRKPDVLALAETFAIMFEIGNPAIRLAVLVAGATGSDGRTFVDCSGTTSIWWATG